jgi:hypothetical protein
MRKIIKGYLFIILMFIKIGKNNNFSFNSNQIFTKVFEVKNYCVRNKSNYSH